MKILILASLLGLFLLSYVNAQAALAPVASKTVVQPFPATLARIGTCESNNDPLAKNASSTASGRFQFIHSTWVHYAKVYWGDDWTKHDVFNYADNTSLALWVYNNFGTEDWSESSRCWQNI